MSASNSELYDRQLELALHLPWRFRRVSTKLHDRWASVKTDHNSNQRFGPQIDNRAKPTFKLSTDDNALIHSSHI